MGLEFNILIFIISAGLLYVSGELITSGLVRLARFFGWKEFVVAFFVMAVAASMPNLFVGVTSALQGIPELSFGDIMGNNLIALTVAVGLAVIFSPKKEIPAGSRTIQSTAVFTMVAAILPLLLLWDGMLSRTDGLILIVFFLYYLYWLFSKKERFTKVYEEHDMAVDELKFATIDLVKIITGAIILFVAAQGIVQSAAGIAYALNLPLIVIGVLILGLGSALPEVYFAVNAARKGETFLILGNLMGAVIIPASLILGIVALIHPINSGEFEIMALSRFFLIMAGLFFFLFTRTQQTITARESYFLIGLYILFVALVIFTR
jgi:cation:H+ antiporter